MSGVILREKVPAFERFLWRACRGNVYLRVAEIEVPFEDPRTVSLFRNPEITFYPLRFDRKLQASLKSTDGTLLYL